MLVCLDVPESVSRSCPSLLFHLFRYTFCMFPCWDVPVCASVMFVLFLKNKHSFTVKFVICCQCLDFPNILSIRREALHMVMFYILAVKSDDLENLLILLLVYFSYSVG